MCALALVGLALASGGCATYSEKTAAARSAAAAGDYATAIDLFNDFLDVDSAEDVPKRIGSDSALGLLERGTLLQAVDDYALSARDYQIADKELELLDIADDTTGEIGRYVYSDSATRYRSQPTEKLSLNAMNMLNYLAIGDLSGARVEARRFTTMLRYLDDVDPDHAHASFGSYLAGFVFERLGQPETALRYYDEVLRHRSPSTLHAPIARLAQWSRYRGTSIAGFLDGGPPPPRSPEDWADLVVVVNLGRVPHKVPKRIPVGRAIGIAGVFVTGDLSVLQYTATKVVVYPELVDTPSVYTGARVHVSEAPIPIDALSQLGREIAREYEAVKPQILGAAVSRLLVRAAVAEGMRAAGRQQSDLLGAIAALIAEGTMVVVDKPDTRSWTMLPDRVLVARTRVPPGPHTVDIEVAGAEPVIESFATHLEPGGFAVVVATLLR